MKNATKSKYKSAQRRVLMLELLGFATLVLLTWLNLDIVLPEALAHFPFVQSDILISLIQTALICLLAAFVCITQIRSMRRLNFLEGLLPVCSFCKKIRKEGKWIPIEEYVRNHSEADFSHGFCPECGTKHYGDLYRRSQDPGSGTA